MSLFFFFWSKIPSTLGIPEGHREQNLEQKEQMSAPDLMLLMLRGPVRHYCSHINKTGIRKHNWAFTGQVQTLVISASTYCSTLVRHPWFQSFPTSILEYSQTMLVFPFILVLSRES